MNKQGTMTSYLGRVGHRAPKVLMCAITVAVGMLLLTPAGVLAAKLTCLTGTDPSVANDLSEISAVRAAVDAACPCGSFDGSKGKTHANYVTCANGIITAQVSAGTVRTQCKATVKKYYSASTCGVPASKSDVPCIKTSAAGKVTCAITSSTKCAGAPCASFSRCIDAADTDQNGIIGSGDSGACAPTPTPTRPPLNAPTPTPTPFCGDHICNNGETCATCSQDCGSCKGPPPTALPGPVCGDGVCNGAEDCETCPADCGCTAASCSADCGGAGLRACICVAGPPAGCGGVCCTLIGQACSNDADCCNNFCSDLLRPPGDKVCQLN